MLLHIVVDSSGVDSPALCSAPRQGECVQHEEVECGRLGAGRKGLRVLDLRGLRWSREFKEL